MKDLKYLNKYLLRYKYHLLGGIIFVAISNIFQIIPAQLVRESLDIVIEGLKEYQNTSSGAESSQIKSALGEKILYYGLAILAMALLRGFFLFLVRQTIIVMSRHIEYDLKNDIYNHYQTLPLSFYRRNNTGDLMNRIQEDVSRVRMYLGPGIMYGLTLVTLFLILIPYMLSISVKVTLFALIPLPILSLSIYFVNNIINKRSEEIQRSLSDLSTFVQEAFSGIRVIKSFAREEDTIGKFAEESDNYKDRSLALTRVQALFIPLIVTLIGLSTVIVVFVGGQEVLNGNLSYGNIAEFIMYVNLLTWPVASLGWITSIIQRAAASQKRINEFLDTKTDIVSTENYEAEIAGKVAFKNVSFVYPDTGIKALKQVSFTIAPGERIAIIGTTGSGKSTIANLITRMFDVTEGELLVDDKNIKAYTLSSIRGQIGYVPQDVFLFSDTIKNNITFGGITVSEDDIIRSTKDADLYGNIQDFPKGFQTEIGERGITLSGGQKQRLSISRAIVRNPKILVLDDALSAVDTKTENAILNSLEKVMENRTSIMISHRVSTAKLADRIIVLHDGEIVEMGTSKELLAQNGPFKELYDKQLRAEEGTEASFFS